MKNLTRLILLIHAPSLFFPTTFESVNHPELNEDLIRSVKVG